MSYVPHITPASIGQLWETYAELVMAYHETHIEPEAYIPISKCEIDLCRKAYRTNALIMDGEVLPLPKSQS